MLEFSSLNHIFLLEEDSEIGIREIFDGELWATMFNSIKTEFVSSQLSDHDVLRCHAMCKASLRFLIFLLIFYVFQVLNLLAQLGCKQDFNGLQTTSPRMAATDG